MRAFGFNSRMIVTFWIVGLCALLTENFAGDPIRIWPGLAPGESTEETGKILPFRKEENPPVTRVVDISCPTMEYFPAKSRNGRCVVILPGGGFGKVVPDKEGSEFARILNQAGVSAFVLQYRTKGKNDKVGWKKPLQDAQRAIAWVRANALKYDVKPNQIGLVGFSAGGNVAARLLCGQGKKSYPSVDAIDQTSHRPDFAMLIYPWNIYDAKTDKLVDGLTVPRTCPPVFLVHTHDDRSSALGSVLFYAELKKFGIPAELHVYVNGGHGYGTRIVKGSAIDRWTSAALRWLDTLK